MDIIGIKPAPGNNESNFKKVGANPCGCNTNGTIKSITKLLFRVDYYKWVNQKHNVEL